MTKKVIYHFSCPNTNVGDNALTIGVINSFRNYFDKIVIKRFCLRGTLFTPEYINYLNKNCDLILIGGGGLLHCSPAIRRKKSHNSGTLWEISFQNIEKIKVPFVLYGVGYNVFRGESDLPPIAKKSINIMIQRALLFSVRNDGSRDRLITFLGYNDKRIKVIPDPGLYCMATTNKWTIDKSKINIAIQLAFDRVEYRFHNLKDTLKKIRDMIDHYSKENYVFWLIPHVKLDNQYINKYFKGYNKLPYIPTYLRCKEIMAFYKDMDIVIGMRGHANICPFGLGIPIIALVSHDKNEGFMRDAGIQGLCVDLNNPYLESELIGKVKYILDNKEDVINHIKNTNIKYKAITNKTNQFIVNSLKNI